jgi:hypothetical protein
MTLVTPADRRRLPPRIDVREVVSVDYWCRTFGVTRQQLCNAVSIVGSNADIVGRHLRRGQPVS